jgi:RNA polymerase sigma-70 factor (ECF subfamily)
MALSNNVTAVDGRSPTTHLITNARQGSQAAWEMLVRQHQEHAFRLAYLILCDAVEAEEVAQEAFIRAYL